jgi:hypothetical protein
MIFQPFWDSQKPLGLHSMLYKMLFSLTGLCREGYKTGKRLLSFHTPNNVWNISSNLTTLCILFIISVFRVTAGDHKQLI